jgi:acyl-CoA dehydrogenase
MYVPSEEMRSDATAVLEAALHATIACEPIEKKLRQAVKSGVVVPQAGQDTAQLARAKEVISADEYARWEEKEALRKTVIQVDDFPQDFGRAEFMARLEAESPRVAAKAA